MYYINNNTYVCNIGNIKTALSDIHNKGFSKRDLVIFKPEGDVIILGDVLDDITTQEFTLTETSSMLEVANSEKNIVCFVDSLLMDNMVMSYYLSIANMLGVNRPRELVDMTYPALSDAKEVDETFSIDTTDAKGIPFNLLFNSLNYEVNIKKFNQFFIDKVDSSKTKILLTELHHIVKDNFMENKIDFIDNSDIFTKILELRAKSDLVIQDWYDLYELISVISPPPTEIEDFYTISEHEVEKLKFSTAGEMHLVTKLFETSSDDESFMGLIKAAVNDNCKYFRNLDRRSNYLEIS
jgi:hypothetical protein